jgi:vacuolar-type H+-ATPase subunit H
MSTTTRKEQTTTTNTTASTSTTSPAEQNAQYQQTVNRALDETRDNIRKATDEARKEIPRYTQAFNEYQEQTIQAAREIADNYVESQKQIINSLQSAWLPQIEAANRVFTSNWMVSPRHLADNYARVVSNIADNTVTATRLVNNTIFANMEAFKRSIQNARDNAREFSRIGVNSAKTLEQVSSRDNNTTASGATAAGTTTTTTSSHQ